MKKQPRFQIKQYHQPTKRIGTAWSGRLTIKPTYILFHERHDKRDRYSRGLTITLQSNPTTAYFWLRTNWKWLFYFRGTIVADILISSRSVWLPNYENYPKVAEVWRGKAPEEFEFKLSNFHTCTLDYVLCAPILVPFQSDNYMSSYPTLTYLHHPEVSKVVFLSFRRFHWQTLCFWTIWEHKTVVAKLGLDLLRALSSKTKSVQTDRSVIFNRIRILKFNDAK